jgi:hypothetical protein
MALNINSKLYALTTSYNFEQPVLGELTETIRIVVKELVSTFISPDSIVISSLNIINPKFTSPLSAILDIGGFPFGPVPPVWQVNGGQQPNVQF